jgi:carboxyl-terminal processing protease
MRKPIIIIGIVAVFAVGLGLGGAMRTNTVQAQREQPAAQKQLTDQDKADLKVFWEVWRLTRGNYVRKVPTEKEMMYGATSGIVESLGDKHSAFLNPEEAKLSQESMSGTFQGIGAVVELKDGVPVIKQVMPGSPAEKSGLKEDDRILAIDGWKTEGKSLNESVRHIRGLKGTPVKLMIGREGKDDPFEVVVVRDEIRSKPVEWKVVRQNGLKIGVIKLTGFTFASMVDFQLAALELVEQGVKAIVLDMRGNPGGLLFVSVVVASWWTGTDVVTVSKSRDGSSQEYANKRGLPLFRRIPTVVLVNKNSASASEVVAAALQDYGYAKIVGEKTYGKGSGQTPYRLSDGSELRLTTFLWYTPKGRTIEDNGVKPDIEVKLTKEDRLAKRDPQMDRALELLSGKK